MSERKTSEIKLRVTPSFKAAVQLAAEQAGETMSVYIESASQDRIDAESATASPNADKVAESWGFQGCPSRGKPCNCTGACMKPIGYSAVSGTTQIATVSRNDLGWPVTQINPPVAQNPVPAKNADGSCTKNCHPWEWCECKQLRRD